MDVDAGVVVVAIVVAIVVAVDRDDPCSVVVDVVVAVDDPSVDVVHVVEVDAVGVLVALGPLVCCTWEKFISGRIEQRAQKIAAERSWFV